MEENQENTQQTQEERQYSAPVSTQPAAPRRKTKPILIVLIILSIVLILGGVFYFLGSRKDGEGEASPTPAVLSIEQEETPSPAPSESPEEVDKSGINIQILNGTGISGEAAYLEGKLKALGYSKIEVGNSSSQDTTATSVTFAKDLSQKVIDEVTKELQSTYQQVNTKTSSTGNFDISITTGLRKGQTSKPESTSTSRPTSSPSTTPRASASPSATPRTSPSPTATSGN